MEIKNSEGYFVRSFNFTHGRGITFYSYVSDQYSQYGVLPPKEMPPMYWTKPWQMKPIWRLWNIPPILTVIRICSFQFGG